VAYAAVTDFLNDFGNVFALEYAWL